MIKGNVFMASNLGRVMIEALEVLAINIARGTTDPWVDTITGSTL